MNTRETKAAEIADKFRIVESSGKWLVPSQSSTKKSAVRIVGSGGDCTCPDFEERQSDCKHVMAVRMFIEREQNPDGSTTITETFEMTKRTTYPQDWPAYNLAQTTEQDHFQRLLAELCSGITTQQPRTGRPRLLLSDALFSAVYKVYSTVSGRRFMSDLRESKERGHIDAVPHYNSIFNYLENPKLTPILTNLIVQASLPLKTVETDFAADSTGFSTSKFERWYDHKWGKDRFRHEFVKVHIMTGVKTNTITAVEITDKSDTSMLKPLLATTSENFQIAEISADKGYLSYSNARAIVGAGALPFIAFKKDSGPGNCRKEGILKTKAWADMYHYFNFRRDEFLQHYHKRSNVETTFSMVKRKFGDSIRSKTPTAMVNEALAKILCHNIVVLVHEIHELGIAPVFWTEDKRALTAGQFADL